MSEGALAKPHLLSSLVAGGAAGCISKTCVAPLSRLVMLRQVQSMPGESGLTVVQLFKGVTQAEGFFGFWRGNGATILHRACTSGITFFTIAAYHHMIPREKLAGLENFKQSLFISSIGALCSISLAHPLDVAKTRLITEWGSPESRYYRTTSSTLMKIAKDEGIRGLYRGLGLSITSAVPAIALNFAFFTSLRPIVCGPREPACKLQVALCGGVSAACASTILFPLDLLKKQMQLVGQRGTEKVYENSLDAAKAVWRRAGGGLRGVRGFYHGLPLEVMKVTPGGGILFVANEFVLSLLKPQNSITGGHG